MRELLPETCRYKEELPFDNCTGFWFDNGVEPKTLNSSNENRYHFIMMVVSIKNV